jgi:hypothetical protein
VETRDPCHEPSAVLVKGSAEKSRRVLQMVRDMPQEGARATSVLNYAYCVSSCSTGTKGFTSESVERHVLLFHM